MEADSSPQRGILGIWAIALPETIRELWHYRELFYFFAWRDIKVRYKQTVLGLLWAVIQPILIMVVFTILFGRLGNLPSDGAPRPLFYLSALIPWIYFSSTVTGASLSLIANAQLMTKVYFPRTILPASVALSALVDFGVGTAVAAVFVVYFQVPIHLNLLLWPLLLIPLFMLSLSVGMILAALNVKYRDIKYVVPFGIQLCLFLTPIIYPLSMVPERYQFWMAFNPLSGIIQGFRHALVASAPMDWTLLAISLLTTLVLMLVAVAFFNRSERAFADFV